MNGRVRTVRIHSLPVCCCSLFLPLLLLRLTRVWQTLNLHSHPQSESRCAKRKLLLNPDKKLTKKTWNWTDCSVMVLIFGRFSKFVCFCINCALIKSVVMKLFFCTKQQSPLRRLRLKKVNGSEFIKAERARKSCKCNLYGLSTSCCKRFKATVSLGKVWWRVYKPLKLLSDLFEGEVQIYS